MQALREIRASACPHDCPSTCALEVELIDERTIGRVRGSKDNDYTAGVVCAKVARYAEREHHAERLLQPLRRKGAKGFGEFAPISWDDALDLVAEQFVKAEQRRGAESVWPYYYAGTMGLVQRDGINRLRHAMGYSREDLTICSALTDAGWTVVRLWEHVTVADAVAAVIAAVGSPAGTSATTMDSHADLPAIDAPRAG